jgi:DNA-binding MarR family transcriptional regulator
MPTKPKRYPTDVPSGQSQVLREIAIAGELSNTKLKERLEIKHPSISDAIKVLVDRRLVKVSRFKKAGHKGGRPEKYYVLTKEGLDEFIKSNPAPEEFFRALLKSYNLRQQFGWTNYNKMSIKDFGLHYTSYEQNYLGYASIHGYLIQSQFFTKLYEQWLAEYRPALFGQSHLKNITRQVHSSFFEKCYEESLKISDYNGITVGQKVLECLAIHRSITEPQIEELLTSKQKLIEEKLVGKMFRYPDFVQNQIGFHYAITPVNTRRVIDNYTLSGSYIQHEVQKFEDIDYDSIVKKYVEFLSRLVIIKIDCVDGPRYELSLLGVILILAIVTNPHQKMFYTNNGFEKDDNDLAEFYCKVSKNYADKLPLVFGKWTLLTKTRNYAYQWFLPILYQKLEDDFTRAIRPGSVTVTLGGVKEYQETMQEIAFHTTARLFDLYRSLSVVLQSADQNSLSDEQLQQQSGLLALELKQKELSALLKYTDLSQFVEKLKDNKNLTEVNQHLKLVYNFELPIIEKALASEITFLFYINLARERFLDYTDEGRNFLGDERDMTYKDYQDKDYNDQGHLETIDIHIQKPIDLLEIILKTDTELMDTFLGWMTNINDYRRRSAGYMNKFEMTVKKWKSKSK